jgi:hypothetical protein
MVLSSYSALNMIGSGSMRELNHYISNRLDGSVRPADVVKPVGLHFVVQDKIFIATNQPRLVCPINFLLGDQTVETKLCRPVFTELCLRCKVNRKAKIGVKKLSVIRLDDFSVVAHEKAPAGYLIFIRSYDVVKKDVDHDVYDRWRME